MNENAGIQAVNGFIEILAEPETQELIRKVLMPELSQQKSRRSSIEIDDDNSRIHIRVKGMDLSSFRASANSVLRILNVIVEIQKVIKIGRHRKRRPDA